MQFLRKLATSAMIFAMLAQNAVNATTYYYRGNAGPAMQTASTPPDPNSNPSAFAILAQGPNYAVVGALYSATTYAYNNTGAVTFAITSGSLPAGMAINPQTGTISGTPTVSSSSTVTVVVAGTDSGTQNVATSSLSFDVINPFSISSNPGALVYVGTPYSVSFFLAGGSTPYSFSETGLPAGLSFTPSGTSGLLNGAPIAPGTYNIIVTGQESHGLTAAFPYTLTVVADLALTGSPPTTGNVGTAYQGQFTTVGGVAPYTYRLLTGSLPTGLSLNATTGLISGNPLVAANKTGLSVQVTDADGAVATSSTFAINIGARLASPLVISGTPSTSGKETFFYTAQYSATGGSGSGYIFSLTSGTLPNGITLSSAGLLSGTPVVGSAGTYSGLQVRVADGAGHTAFSPIFILTIAPAPPPTLSIAGQALNPTFGASYTVQFTASGGMPAYTYSVSAGTLPPGLSLNATTGLISGSPNQLGTYSNITITAIDAASTIANTQAFNLIVIDSDPLSIAWSPTTSYQVGFPVVDPTTVTGGNASAYAFSITGALPPGLTQNSQTGALTGNFASTGTFGPLVITVTDGVRIASTTVATFIVGNDTLTIAGSPAQSSTLGSTYTAQFTSLGGAGGNVFSLAAGALPPGVTLNAANGLLNGVTDTLGDFTGIQIKVTDSSNAIATSNVFSIAVGSPPPPPPPQDPLGIFGTPADGVYGQAYSVSFSGGGGAPPYSYALTAGTLPAGLSFDASSGTISGTPSQIGTFPNLQVTVTDSATNTAATPAFSIAVTDRNPLTITWSPQTSWQIDDFVASAPTVDGGDPNNYSFSIVGAVPPGLSLFSNGTLFGSLSQAGTFGPFQIQVTDGVRTAITQPAIFTVALPGLFVSGFPAADASENQAYSAQFTAQGGSGSGYAFSINGTLPSGLTLDPNSSGLISGTPAIGRPAATPTSSVHVVDDASNAADFDDVFDRGRSPAGPDRLRIPADQRHPWRRIRHRVLRHRRHVFRLRLLAGFRHAAAGPEPRCGRDAVGHRDRRRHLRRPPGHGDRRRLRDRALGRLLDPGRRRKPAVGRLVAGHDLDRRHRLHRDADACRRRRRPLFLVVLRNAAARHFAGFLHRRHRRHADVRRNLRAGRDHRLRRTAQRDHLARDLQRRAPDAHGFRHAFIERLARTALFGPVHGHRRRHPLYVLAGFRHAASGPVDLVLRPDFRHPVRRRQLSWPGCDGRRRIG